MVSTLGTLPFVRDEERNVGARPISFDTVRWLFPPSSHILCIASFVFMGSPFDYHSILS